MKKILLVDDDEDVLAALHRLLDQPKRAWSCRTARNGREALAQLEIEETNLLITDLKMPEMNGFELLDEVNQHYPKLPTLVLSSLAGISDMENLQNRDNLQVLEKPVHATVLEDLVARALAVPAFDSGEIPVENPRRSLGKPFMTDSAAATADTTEFLDGQPIAEAQPATEAGPPSTNDISTQTIPIEPEFRLPEPSSGALVLLVATRSTGAVLSHLLPPQLDESLEHKLSGGKQTLFLEPEVMERLSLEGLEELAFVCSRHCEILRPLPDHPDFFLYGLFRREDFNIAMASLTLRSVEANAHKLATLQEIAQDPES
ncbi:MAG: response regulator [Acidobacteriota bacterium]|nr:response regulator [Acidobacteriota bacterium]